MDQERPGMVREDDELPRLPFGWKAAFVLGLITLVLGAIVTARPTQSLTVIAVLLGVIMVVSGVFHIVRALDGRENERVWRGISGVLFIVAGLVLIRHLHLSLALIGLFIGFTWIIQGVSALMEGASRGGTRSERGWSLFFGVLSLIAGIVVVAAPIASVAALTIFMGVWFMVMGFMEMLGALLGRRALRKHDRGQVNVPGQRPGEHGERAPADAAGEGTAAEDSVGNASRNIPS
jgi:uncharacterized membrane protein HdeD (DUF308 family)